MCYCSWIIEKNVNNLIVIPFIKLKNGLFNKMHRYLLEYWLDLKCQYPFIPWGCKVKLEREKEKSFPSTYIIWHRFGKISLLTEKKECNDDFGGFGF